MKCIFLFMCYFGLCDGELFMRVASLPPVNIKSTLFKKYAQRDIRENGKIQRGHPVRQRLAVGAQEVRMASAERR